MTPIGDDRFFLGIETSCDETSVALLRGDGVLAGHAILSQDVHRIYGGVVPELAARAHLRRIDEVAQAAFREAGIGIEEVAAVGATVGPGLIGALLVGSAWGKALAYARKIPFVGVHHLEGHLFSPAIEDPDSDPPFVALLVSGGHTLLLWVPEWGRYHLLGETRDDAAGEAFDKTARLLGLPYPGGPQIERIARDGDPHRHPLPHPMVRRNAVAGDDDYWDFSFSGLKTAVARAARSAEEAGTLEADRPHLAAAFQEAVVAVLLEKTLRAVRATGCPRVLLAGGVSANRRLRDALARGVAEWEGGGLRTASPRLSLDNAAMIAKAGLFRLERDGPAPLDGTADPRLPLPGLIRGELPSPAPRPLRRAGAGHESRHSV